MKPRAFTLIEMLVASTIVLVLGMTLTAAGWKAYEKSSLAVSANNIRLLAAGGSAYLVDNNYVFWPYKKVDADKNAVWWFGFETFAGTKQAEGTRTFDPEQGPLGGYVPKAIRPDPSFAFTGKAFKPKYRNGYLGIGYNVLLGGKWQWDNEGKSLRKYWELSDPSKVVVFFTSAQVNTFQAPASSKNPMIEEFYGIDETFKTAHFRHAGQAMVGFANGSAGFLPMDETSRDSRAPEAHIGRFAPVGSKKYLE